MQAEAMQESLKGSLCPAIDRPIDNTALSAYLTCPREYFFAMVLSRRSKGRSPSLTFGKAWHKALETHYKTNGNRDKVRLEVMKSWQDHDAVDDYRTVMRVLGDYDKYLAEYGLPEKEQRKTVGYPHEPLVELSTNCMSGGLVHPWAGKLDRIYEESSLVYIEDHKTTSRLDKNYFGQFWLSYQMKGYVFLGQQLLPNSKVVGVRINLSHILTTKTKFEAELFTYTPDVIEEWVQTTNTWMLRLNADYEAWWELVKEFDSPENVPWEAINKAFPAHFGDNACSRKFGLCSYHEVCRIGPRLRNKMLERNFEINVWNPLEAEDDE